MAGQPPTRRQVEVLRAYISAGSIAAAAYELGISETTARQHRRRGSREARRADAGTYRAGTRRGLPAARQDSRHRGLAGDDGAPGRGVRGRAPATAAPAYGAGRGRRVSAVTAESLERRRTRRPPGAGLGAVRQARSGGLPEDAIRPHTRRPGPRARRRVAGGAGGRCADGWVWSGREDLAPRDLPHRARPTTRSS
jgi:hypothetical protein